MRNTRPKKIEVVAIVAEPQTAKDIPDDQLLQIYTTFQEKVGIIRTESGDIVIFAEDDQKRNQLLALLPFMPNFDKRRLVIDKKKMEVIHPIIA